MTKRYSLHLQLTADSEALLDITVHKKTMETLQQVIRLVMSDMEKVDPTPPKKHRWGIKGGRIDPPLEPTAEEAQAIK